MHIDFWFTMQCMKCRNTQAEYENTVIHQWKSKIHVCTQMSSCFKYHHKLPSGSSVRLGVSMKSEQGYKKEKGRYFQLGDCNNNPQVSLMWSHLITSEAVNQQFDLRLDHFSTCMMFLSIKLADLLYSNSWTLAHPFMDVVAFFEASFRTSVWTRPQEGCNGNQRVC